MYRGRIAPTPTGRLHLGHAATFHAAWRRARERRGQVVLRIEDLDPQRCRPEFSKGMIEDLRWLGLDWDEGPVHQSARRPLFLDAWRRLRDGGWIYPCARSRRDVAEAALAPHEEEPIYPPAWRAAPEEALSWAEPRGVNWRFRVPDGETLSFPDGARGEVRRTAGADFGDFLVWNRDDVPAYELAVVVDDLAMDITEVVRGEDLLTSTCRQLLLYRALGGAPPAFYHCPLVRDAEGRRLSKRGGALELRALREAGKTAEEVLREAAAGLYISSSANSSFSIASSLGGSNSRKRSAL
ncbi:MAG: tRNA glutamyl-Q(34) synthetase GluQRS [Verrucomicrobium sp.]|nr:tRNA glutamyl-Q(34) synthetase GluQRS [Verrucomicrobium sp.]